MATVLLVTSSPRGNASYSTRVATELADGLGGRLIHRDLSNSSLKGIDESFLAAMQTPEPERTREELDSLSLSDELIGELRDADTVVIGAAMINFGMPAELKHWVDLVTRVGVTVKYGEAGPEGQLTGKRVILVLASGGVYSAGPASAMNHLEPALRTNLAFLGMKDVETIWIEGTLHGEEIASAALLRAQERIREVVHAGGFAAVA